MRTPKRRAVATISACAGLAVGAGLGEAGRDDDDGRDAGPAALLDHLDHLGGGHADDGEVDLVGHCRAPLGTA